MSWLWDDAGNTRSTGDAGDARDAARSGPTAHWASDEALLEDLGDALTEARLTESVLSGARSAFAAHRAMLAEVAQLDVELLLLTLVYDSLQDVDAVGVRDRSGEGSRTLVFESDDLGVEIELESGGIEGQLIPPRAGRVTLRAPDEAIATAETDEVGYFRFDVRPSGPLRLECASETGTCVTEWLPW